MAKIYAPNWRYDLLRYYVDWCCKTSYRRAEVVGLEHIPKEGAVVFAPNHCNTLMDALVVLRSRRSETVFGARADVFQHPVLGKIMHFLRILPVVRQRDGLRNVAKNYEMIQTVIETLEHGVPFCLFPEGKHWTKHSLQPFGKGLQRIVLGANEVFGSLRPVYIVPVGLEYGDFFRFRSNSVISFGEPIHVTELLKSWGERSEAECSAEIARLTAEGIARQIIYLPADEQYDARWALLKAITSHIHLRLSKLIRVRKEYLAEMLSKEERNPEACSALYAEALAFEQARQQAKISSGTFRGGAQLLPALGYALLAVVLLPLVLLCGALSFPMWLLSVWLIPRLKDPAFHNTARFALKLLLTPLLVLIWGILLFLYLPWWGALVGLFLTLHAYDWLYDYKELLRRARSHWRLLFSPSLRRQHAALVAKYRAL